MTPNKKNFDNIAVIIVCAVFLISMLMFNIVKSIYISISMLVFYAIIAVNWEKRKQLWFLLLMSVLVMAHLVAIILFDGSLPKGPALAYVVPVTFADGFLMLTIVNMIGSVISRRK